MTEAEWETHLVYVYRVEPKIETADGKGYVGKFSEPIDEDYIKENYGSGKYRVYLNKDHKNVDSHVFKIIDRAYPPDLPGDEWKKNPVNRKWVFDMPKDDEDDDRDDRRHDREADPEERLTKIYDLAERIAESKKPNEAMNARLLELLFEERRSRASEPSQPHDPLGPVLQGLAAFQAAANKPGIGEDLLKILTPIIPLVVERLLNPPTPPAQKSAKEDLAETLAIVAQMKEIFGDESGGRSSRPDWKQSLIEVVPEALGHVSSIVGNVFKRPPMPPGPGGIQQTASDPGQADPNQRRQIESPAAPAALDPPLNEHEMQLAQYLGVIAQPLLNALNTGLSGGDFAAWFMDGYGEAMYRQVVMLGKDGILRAMQGNPEFWQAVQPFHGKRLDTFVEQFVAGPSDDEGNEDGEPGEGEETVQ